MQGLGIDWWHLYEELNKHFSALHFQIPSSSNKSLFNLYSPFGFFSLLQSASPRWEPQISVLCEAGQQFLPQYLSEDGRWTTETNIKVPGVSCLRDKMDLLDYCKRVSHITLNIRNKPNKNNVPKPITKISSAFSKSRPISIITQDPSKYLPKRRLFERQKKKNLNSIIDSRTHRTDYDGGLY